jgi:phosphoribosylformylglycinamidine synthase
MHMCAAPVQCFNVEVTEQLTEQEADVVAWLLRETYAPGDCTAESQIVGHVAKPANVTLIEVGPRLTFSTAFSANAVSACASCGIDKITRLERSRRYSVKARGGGLSDAETAVFAGLVHDRMTEEVYATPLRSFKARPPCCRSPTYCARSVHAANAALTCSAAYVSRLCT